MLKASDIIKDRQKNALAEVSALAKNVKEIMDRIEKRADSGFVYSADFANAIVTMTNAMRAAAAFESVENLKVLGVEFSGEVA